MDRRQRANVRLAIASVQRKEWPAKIAVNVNKSIMAILKIINLVIVSVSCYFHFFEYEIA